MPVTVRYRNGTAAVFASVDEALAQSAHDLSQPGQLDPVDVLDGDHSEVHALWREQAIAARAQAVDAQGSASAPEPLPAVVDAPDHVKVLHDRDAVAELVCECVECEFQREAPKLGVDAGAQQQELLERLRVERYRGERP